MPKRKLFENLSDRQKRRRLDEHIFSDMREVENKLLQKSIARHENLELNAESTVDEIVEEDLLQAEHDLSNLTKHVDTAQAVPSPTILEHQKNEHVVENQNYSTVLSNKHEQDILHDPIDEYEIFLNRLEIVEDDNCPDIGMLNESDDDYLSDESSISIIDSTSSIDSDDGMPTEQSNLSNKLLDWNGKAFVSRENMNGLLSILREEGHPDLPKDWRTIAKTPHKTKIISCDPGEYFHYGLEQSLTDIFAREKMNETNLLIDINIDGLPLTKSTNRTLWPIRGRIVSYPGISPFIIGVYDGKQKPSSVKQFLDMFVEEYKILNENGFVYRKRRYYISIKCVICDAPAACFVTCTKYYNGRYGCRRCMVEGDWMGRMVFLNYAHLRTDDNFRKREDEDHHTDIVSPFECLNIDMVFQFPLDYMHLVCLGVMKLLLKIWLKFKPKFSAAQLEKLSADFVNLGKYIPKEFNRKPQSLLELHHWKATTARFFLLYAGPIILNGHIPDELVLHFNHFSIGIRILCDPKQYLKNNSYAEELLVKFVKQFMTLYQKQYLTFNLHSLGHLAADAKVNGYLDSFSAFDFENYMKFLKKLIRKNEKPLQQIHRRLSEQRHPSNKRKSTVESYPLLICRKMISLPFGCHSCHNRLKFTNFELSDSSPNNCCILNDKSVICIDYIGKNESGIVVIGKKWLKKIAIPNFPEDSLKFGICQVRELSDIQIFSANDIKKKACLFYHNNEYYSISIIHG